LKYSTKKFIKALLCGVALVLALLVALIAYEPAGPVMPGRQAQLVNALKDARARYEAASSNQQIEESLGLI
jgi:F0F1-type ATP synthase membrane subunit b/b'